MRKTVFIIAACAAAGISCEREKGSDTGRPDASIAFEIGVDNNSGTKAAPAVNEDGISDINLFLYNTHGKLAFYSYSDSWDSNPLPVDIHSGSAYSVYAIANAGDLTDSKDILTREGIEAMTWKIDSPEKIVNAAGAMPMSAYLPPAIYKDGESCTVNLRRMLSKFRIIADTSGLDGDVGTFTIRQIRLRNMNSSVRYFDTSRAGSDEEVFSEGISMEGTELDALYTTGVDFYLTENAQGDLLTDNIDESTHIPPAPYDRLCTYVEFVVDYRNSEHYNDSLVYRYYLHDGRFLDNFDILRNTMYTCRTVFTGTGINEQTWRIDVSGMKDLVTGIIVTPESHTFRTEGETFRYTATVLPASAENPAVTWRSENEDVATVSDDGTVTAVSDGTCRIIATSTDGTLVSGSATAVVDTYKEPSSIAVSPPDAEMYTGETLTLTATVLPEDANDRSVSWISSDPATVSVSRDGTVKAIRAGTAFIIASTVANSLKDSARISVKDKFFAIDEFPAVLYPSYNSPVTVPYRAEPSATPSFSIITNSGDASGASVSGDILTASNPGISQGEIGSYTLTATVHGITSSRDFSVNAGSIVLPDNATMYPGKRERILPRELIPSDIDVSWTSSDPQIATVDQNGTISTKGLGRCTIQAKTAAGAWDDMTVNVTLPALLFSDTVITAYEGGQLTLSARTVPRSDFELEFSVVSGDEYISVTGNILTGLKRTPVRENAKVMVRYKDFPDIYRTAEVAVRHCLSVSISGNDSMVNTFGHTSVGNFSGGVGNYIRLDVFRAPHVDIVWKITDTGGNDCTEMFDISGNYILSPASRYANGPYTITGCDQSGRYPTAPVKFYVYQLLTYEVGLGEYSLFNVGNVQYYQVSLFACWSQESWALMSQGLRNTLTSVGLVSHVGNSDEYFSIGAYNEKKLFVEHFQTSIRWTSGGIVNDLRQLTPLSWICVDLNAGSGSVQGITGSYLIIPHNAEGGTGYYYIKQSGSTLCNLDDFVG